MAIVLAVATVIAGLVMAIVWEMVWIFFVGFPAAYVVYCTIHFSALVLYGYAELIETNQTIARQYSTKQQQTVDKDELPDL